MMTIPTRIILALMLSLLVFSACAQKDDLTAIKRRAEQGNVDTQAFLGFMYRNNLRVDQDYEEAFRWYQSAAYDGHVKAMYNLGLMHEYGQGVPQDYTQAYMWDLLAVSTLTGQDREFAVSNRDAIAEKMTPEQIAEAQRLASEWKPKE